MDQQETKYFVKSVDATPFFSQNQGGVMLYVPEEAPGQTDSKRVLETILGGDE